MYAVGFTIMMILNLFRHRDYSISTRRTVLYTLVTYVYGVSSAVAMGKIYSLICRAMGTMEGSNVAIFGAVTFCPLLLMATVTIEKAVNKAADNARDAKKKRELGNRAPVSMRSTVDLLTPGIFIILACAKFGCHFEGCCFGVRSDWGVYNGLAQGTVFPVQMFEFATMCVIIVLCFFLKRQVFYRRGMAYPMTAGIYSVARFFWEFKRYYSPEMRHVVFSLTFWQFCCVIVFAASVISVIVLYKTQPSEPLPAWKKKQRSAESGARYDGN